MCKIISKDQEKIQVRLLKDTIIIPYSIYRRAKKRGARNSKIRNPKKIIIEDHIFVFTKMEWAKLQMATLNEKNKQIADVYLYESKVRFVRHRNSIYPVPKITEK